MSEENKKRDSVVRLGISLCLICAFSTAAMAFAFAATKDLIANVQSKRMIDSFRLILPDFDNDISRTAVTVDGVQFFTAVKAGKTVGYAAKASVPDGYAGKVEGVVGFSPDGKIVSFIITEHSETPGLGGNVAGRFERKTIFDLFSCKSCGAKPQGLPPNRVLDSFIGHSAAKSDSWKQPWRVAKDGGSVEQISGATVTSRAVTKIAWKAAETFFRSKDSLSKGAK